MPASVTDYNFDMKRLVSEQIATEEKACDVAAHACQRSRTRNAEISSFPQHRCWVRWSCDRAFFGRGSRGQMCFLLFPALCWCCHRPRILLRTWVRRGRLPFVGLLFRLCQRWARTMSPMRVRHRFCYILNVVVCMYAWGGRHGSARACAQQSCRPHLQHSMSMAVPVIHPGSGPALYPMLGVDGDFVRGATGAARSGAPLPAQSHLGRLLSHVFTLV